MRCDVSARLAEMRKVSMNVKCQLKMRKVGIRCEKMCGLMTVDSLSQTNHSQFGLHRSIRFFLLQNRHELLMYAIG